MNEHIQGDALKRVSVCMATYNGEPYIRQQIDSILFQLGPHDELVISDDGSTDSTISIINSYQDARIRLFHHQRALCHSKYYRANRHVASNFENALKHSEGMYIFLSDQDDIWDKRKVERMMEAIDEKGGLVMSSFQVIDADGSIKKGKVTPSTFSFLRGLVVAKFLGSTMGMSRDFLRKALPFPENTISHDSWLGLLAIRQRKLTVIGDVLLLYRRHHNNVTSKKKKTPLYAKLKYRCGLLFQIMERS